MNPQVQDFGHRFLVHPDQIYRNVLEIFQTPSPMRAYHRRLCNWEFSYLEVAVICGEAVKDRPSLIKQALPLWVKLTATDSEVTCERSVSVVVV